MEADISIWHKPGHFYFALTLRIQFQPGAQNGGWEDGVGEVGSRMKMA
jgi:hypothetical protein